MKRFTSILIAGFSLLFLSGCTVQPTVSAIDFSKQKGAYIVGYSESSDIRIRMEDQLVADLADGEILAFASYKDITEIRGSTPQDVIKSAQKKRALAIIVINQVAADGSGSILKNPKRISPVHPTLQAFYTHSRKFDGGLYKQDQAVFAEVNLFLLNNGETNLFWGGTTWSFHADDKGGAIQDISKIIAEQLMAIKNRYQ